jgi:hypothetical protein
VTGAPDQIGEPYFFNPAEVGEIHPVPVTGLDDLVDVEIPPLRIGTVGGRRRGRYTFSLRIMEPVGVL